MADEAEVTTSEPAEEPANPFAAEPVDDTVELLGQDDDDAEGTTQEPEPKPSEVGDQQESSKAAGRRADVLTKLINEKYAGDEEKFVEGLHHQWNSAAELAKALKEVRAELAELKTQKPADPEEIFKSDPDLASLGDQRDLVAQELEALEAGAASIRNAFKEANEAKIRAEVLESKADDYDKREHAAEVRRLKGVIADLEASWKRLPMEQKRLQLQLKVIDNQITQAKSAIQSRSKSQKQQEAVDNEKQAGFRTTVDSLIDQAIKEAKIPAGSPSSKRMDKYIRMSIREVLSGLPDDAPGIDPILAVKHFADEYLEDRATSQKEAFKSASTAKQNGKPVPSQQSPQKTPLPGAKRVKAGELTKEMIAAHHKKVFNLPG